MTVDNTTSRPDKKTRLSYQKVLQEDLPTEGSILHQWEQISRKRFGVSKAASWIVLAAIAILLLVTLIFLGRWMFSSPTNVAELESQTQPQKNTQTPSGIDLSPTSDQSSFFGDGGFSSTTTIISSHIGADGKMVTETTTEKIGTDKDGQTKATRETKKGQGAGGEAEKMMTEMNNMMGGFNLGGILDGLFGQPQPDPIQQMLGGVFGGHHQHRHGDPFGDLFGGPQIQMHIGAPLGMPANQILELRPQRRRDPISDVFGGLINALQGFEHQEPIHRGGGSFRVINLADVLGENSGTSGSSNSDNQKDTPTIQVIKPQRGLEAPAVGA